jgi:hypothetical protein
MIIDNLDVKYITNDTINYCSKLTQYTVKKTHNSYNYENWSKTITRETFNKNNRAYKNAYKNSKHSSIFNYKNG